VTRFARALLDAVVANDRTRLGELVRRTFVAKQRSRSTPRFTDRSRSRSFESNVGVTHRHIDEESRAHQ
jgi:hypothetical protein